MRARSNLINQAEKTSTATFSLQHIQNPLLFGSILPHAREHGTKKRIEDSVTVPASYKAEAAY